jgi:hypothetical protein
VCLFLAPFSAFADPVYAWDNGTATYSSLGSKNQVVLVGFQTEAGRLDIAGMQLFHFAGSPLRHPITFALWSDPTGDGDPTDAQLVTSVQSTIGSGWQTALFPQVSSFQAGQWFYVGAYLTDPNVAYFITGTDNGVATGNSRQYFFADGATVNLSNLGGSATAVEHWVPGGLGGNLLIRAVPTSQGPGHAVPEPSAIALSLSVAGLALVLRRKRS